MPSPLVTSITGRKPSLGSNCSGPKRQSPALDLGLHTRPELALSLSLTSRTGGVMRFALASRNCPLVTVLPAQSYVAGMLQLIAQSSAFLTGIFTLKSWQSLREAGWNSWQYQEATYPLHTKDNLLGFWLPPSATQWG